MRLPCSGLVLCALASTGCAPCIDARFADAQAYPADAAPSTSTTTTGTGGAGGSSCTAKVIVDGRHADRTCDGYTGDHVWTSELSTTGDAGLNAIVADAQGNLVVTGYFGAELILGGETLTSEGMSDIFVVKLDPTGTPIWSRSFGSPEKETGIGIAVSPAGTIAIVGVLQGPSDLGTGVLLPSEPDDKFDLFVAMLAGDGETIWARRIGGADNQWAHSVAVDSAGAVLLTGTTLGPIDFGPGTPLPAVLGETDIFVAKLSGLDGSHVWSVFSGGAGEQIGTGITIDDSDNVLVTGTFDNGLSLGGASPIASPPGNANATFVAKLSPDGAGLWNVPLGPSDVGGAEHTIATDSVGNVYVSAELIGDVELSGRVVDAKGSGDIFVAKLDPSGQVVWARALGDETIQRGTAVDVDADDNVVLTGYYQGVIDLGFGEVENLAEYDVLLTKLDSNGELLWAWTMGQVGRQFLGDVAIGPDGRVSLGVVFDGPIDVGSESYPSPFPNDILVASFDP